MTTVSVTKAASKHLFLSVYTDYYFFMIESLLEAMDVKSVDLQYFSYYRKKN